MTDPMPTGREGLPISGRPSFGPVTYDAKGPETRFPPIDTQRPRAGAPDVVVVLLEDIGFGASSAFGGPVQMPVAERRAGSGRMTPSAERVDSPEQRLSDTTVRCLRLQRKPALIRDDQLGCLVLLELHTQRLGVTGRATRRAAVPAARAARGATARHRHRGAPPLPLNSSSTTPRP